MTDQGRSTAPDGAMTDATGSLTPADSDEEFIPAERRAIEHPGEAHAVSSGARRRRVADAGTADEPGSLDDRPLEELAPNARDGGYGSEHGLAQDDPAYDFSERTESEDDAAR